MAITVDTTTIPGTTILYDSVSGNITVDYSESLNSIAQSLGVIATALGPDVGKALSQASTVGYYADNPGELDKILTSLQTLPSAQLASLKAKVAQISAAFNQTT